MPLNFESPKGRRFHRTHFINITALGSNLWWCREKEKWVPLDETGSKGSSSHCPKKCHSVRAFRRRLRKWASYVPKGTKFTLVSRYVGGCVTGTIP